MIARSTPIGRWAGLGPYYAMFPTSFAFEVVDSYCPVGGRLIDPFAGRSTSVFAATSTNRSAVGIEINPVGWLYGAVKTGPAPKEEVVRRLHKIGRLVGSPGCSDLDESLPFFRACYSLQVLRFLLAARKELSWYTNHVDATLMSIILVYLHGKRDQSLSNQMRQGKAMSPDYSVRWWEQRAMTPPELDPVQFLERRIEWRYAKGIPQQADSRVIHGDSTVEVPKLVDQVTAGECEPFDLLFTSPPYYAVTNYTYDQWLRIWMLGGPDRPTRAEGVWEKKFESQERYVQLLDIIFTSSSALLRKNATVYVRTDARAFTREATTSVLIRAFPRKNLKVVPRPLTRQSQTALFGDKSEKPGEVDLILH